MAMAQNNSNFLQDGAFVSSTAPQSLANSGGKPSLSNTINNQALSNTLKQVNKRSYSVDRNSKIHSKLNRSVVDGKEKLPPGPDSGCCTVHSFLIQTVIMVITILPTVVL